MKQLILVRHSKTESGAYGKDFERALTQEGIDSALTISSRLSEQLETTPGLILSSPARRAITTARIFADALSYDCNLIEEDKNLYFQYSTGDFVERLHRIDDKIATLLVVGHNPSIYYFAANFATNFSGNMPPCSTVVIDFDIDSWSQVEARTGIVKVQFVPSMYN